MPSTFFLFSNAKVNYWICDKYPIKKRPLTPANTLEIKGLEGYFVRTVTKFGNSAKIDCPKEYLGRTVYIVVI
ncbi:MAG: DUF2080 family transposase-associated protein [Thermoplasmatales archaeon]